MLLESRAFEQAPLPVGEVGVLKRRLRKGRLAIVAEGLVEKSELRKQNSKRPAVRDDMVHVEQQQVLALGKPPQVGSEERSLP